MMIPLRITTILLVCACSSVLFGFPVEEIEFGSATRSRVSNAQVEEFMKWCEDQGIQHKLRLVDDDYGGKRALATEAIPSGEPVVRIPFSGPMMSSFSAVQSALLDVFRHPQYRTWSQAPRTVLAIHILYEKNNPTSKWAPYLAILPKETDTTLLWSREELEELIGSWVYDRTISDLKGIADEYSGLFPNLFKNFPHMFPPEKYNFEEFLWAFAMIWSRSFSYRATGDKMDMALAPLADMLNHKQSTVARLTPDAEGNNTFVLVTEDSYAAGEEVFNSFGQRPNSDLLQLYGFIVENNPNNTVKLNVELLPSDPHRDYKMVKLNELELYRADYPYSNLPILNEHPSIMLMAMLRLKHFKVPKAKQSQAKQVIDDLALHQKISNSNEAAALNDLQELCEKALRRYPTTIEEDQQIIDSKIFRSHRHELAVKERLEEKLILRKMVTLLESGADINVAF